MKVVIVAKTRMGSGACVGGLTFNGRSVRLIAADQDTNDHFNQEYEIGDVWDVDYSEPPEIKPPHVENIIVRGKRKLPAINDVRSFIHSQMPPRDGGLDVVFDGLTEATSAGALYIAERSGVPDYSTFFWRPDRPLVRADDGVRIRYRYPTAGRGRTLTFVGYQEPLPEIPAGTVLRVSLAHWWRPPEMVGGELRCYVQLSGWFLPAAHETPGESSLPTMKMASQQGDLASSVASATASYDDPATALRQVFGFDGFLPLQEEIIDSVLDGQDVLAVMPTGSGKSLCYQLPALIFSGLTVVVSPLISLMEDQVVQLRELSVPAAALNSTLSYADYSGVIAQVRNRNIKLLYAAPETLLRPETLLLLEQVCVDCLTIDEAHCISEWGHDFRPEYRQLNDVRRRLPDAVCLAVTATATERVRRDIKANLEIEDAGEFIASFDRENLFLAVEPKIDMLAQTLAFLSEHQGESGIIYCATRKQADELAGQLQSHGWDSLPYHAGLATSVRQRNQRQFSHDDVPIMVATIAFGMGIDKSNVRFILHVDLPKDLESYYQQIGRAGRDGLRADCLLLYSYYDANTINFFISQQAESQQIGARLRLEAMLGFAEANGCRRRPLLNHFNESYEAERCDMCDNCTTTADELVDLTVPAQKFLSCVKRTGEKFGANHIIDVLRGSRSKKVLSWGHDRLSTYNIGGEFSKKEWKYLARQFVQQGLLQQDLDHGSLSLTPKAYAVFRGEKVQGAMMQPAQQKSAVAHSYDRDLFQRLRARRKAVADAANVPPYFIFSDRTLVEMATYFPHSPQRFATLYGVGAAKLEKYAEKFLPLIREYCAEKGIEEKRKAVTMASGRRSGKRRQEEVVEMWNKGCSLSDISAHFQVKTKTVLNHLWRAIQAGEELRAANLLEYVALPAGEQRRALAAFAEHGADFLRPVYEALGESISYDDLHLLRLHFALTNQK